MAKTSNPRGRLFETLRYLSSQSDEEHGVTMTQILNDLKEKGFPADRRTVYGDIEAINEAGLLETAGSKVGGVYHYYVVHRTFDDVELRLLVDAVATSRFITSEKSNSLIRKLAGLTSSYEARALNRQIGVAGRVKSMNESIFYQVDEIVRAMENNWQITFTYMQWNARAELVPRKNNPVTLSPFLLTWNNDNYYLIGYVERDRMLKTYRVDKIQQLQIIEAPRLGEEEFKKNDVSSYTRESFGMFNRTPVPVQLTFDNSMAGVLIDRFGTDLGILPETENTSRAFVTVEVSRQFFGWLCGLGNAVRIAEPLSVRQQYREYLQEILKDYI